MRLTTTPVEVEEYSPEKLQNDPIHRTLAEILSAQGSDFDTKMEVHFKNMIHELQLTYQSSPEEFLSILSQAVHDRKILSSSGEDVSAVDEYIVTTYRKLIDSISEKEKQKIRTTITSFFFTLPKFPVHELTRAA